MDRVAELKAKIDDPAYMTDAILGATADRILDQLL
jgi:anti-sigma28 factor (negative regulator of flagellin synthesis)